jgi:hypothetical protein
MTPWSTRRTIWFSLAVSAGLWVLIATIIVMAARSA